MQKSLATLEIALSDDLETLRSALLNVAPTRKSRTELQVVCVDTAVNDSRAAVDVIHATLLERALPRCLLVLNGPNAVSIAQQFLNDFPVCFDISNRMFGPTWCTSILVDEVNAQQWCGLEFENGTSLFPDWQNQGKLQLEATLQWEDFIQQYSACLAEDAQLSFVACLEATIYPETLEMLSTLNSQNLVLVVACGSSRAFIFHDRQQNEFFAKALDDGALLVHSILKSSAT